MAKFKDFIPPRAKAIRDGKLVTVEASELVPGDIIEITSGDKIPADIRIISASDMRVDNSSLTVRLFSLITLGRVRPACQGQNEF